MSTMELRTLTDYLDHYLAVDQFKESAINGLQVAGPGQVRKVAFAVDGVLATFQAAAELGAQLLIVHHGLYWGFQWPLIGPDFDRIKLLMDKGVALYAAHLPLDAHLQVGHAANLLRALGADPDSFEPFGTYQGQKVGCRARIASSSRQALCDRLADVLAVQPQVMPFGPETIETIACVTGGGAGFSFLAEAKSENMDFFISGEGSHPIYHYVREHGLNLALGGHYRTEVFGVKALAAHLEREFGLETHFIEHPTGL